MTKKQFLLEVVKEIEHIKENATKKDLSSKIIALKQEIDDLLSKSCTFTRKSPISTEIITQEVNMIRETLLESLQKVEQEQDTFQDADLFLNDKSELNDNLKSINDEFYSSLKNDAVLGEFDYMGFCV